MANNNRYDWNYQDNSAVKSALNNIEEMIAVMDNENGLTSLAEAPLPSNKVHIQSVEVIGSNSKPLVINQQGQQVFKSQNMNQIGQQAFMAHNNQNCNENDKKAQLQGKLTLNPSVPAKPLHITKYFHNLSRQLFENRISADCCNLIKSKFREISPAIEKDDNEEKPSIIQLRVAYD